MATRNIVPRATGEGQIGTSAKTWSAVYANDIAVTNGVTASTFTGDLTGDVTGDVTGNVTGDVTGDVTGTASGNLALSGGTMTGEIVFSGIDAHGGDSAIQCSTDDDGVRITGASAQNNGASVILYGKDSTNSAGSFIHTARDGVNTVELKGKPNGSLTWGGKKIATSNWKIENVTLSLSGASIKSWGFCHIAYNENVAILSISGLVVGRTISQDTTLCYLPVSSLTNVYAPVHNMSNGSTIAHAVVFSNYVNLNAISNTTDSHAFSIVFPIA